jgi:hypothetical protein
MADERPNVVVQYVTKNDAAPAPTCLEMIGLLVGLVIILVVFGMR